MARKSSQGPCARSVTTHTAIRRPARGVFDRLSSLSNRVSDLLNSSVSAAAPQVGPARAVEPLEGRQLFTAQPTNAGFEAPAVGANNYSAFAYDPSNAGWTFNGASGVSGNGSGFTAANPSAPEGSQVGFVQTTGSMSQSVNFDAGTYTVNFEAAQRIQWQYGLQNFQVLVDGNVVGTFQPTAGGSYAGYQTGAFTVGSGSHTITFQGLDSAGGDNTAFIDNVQVVSSTGLTNAGFESPSVGSGSYSSFAYDPSNAGWTFNGSSGVSGNGSGFTALNPSAPQGSQVGFVQATGSISQTVSLASGTYAISMQAAQRVQWQYGMEDFQVLVDGNVVGTLKPNAGGSYAAYQTNAFTVSGGTHTITLKGLDSAGGDNTAFIDNVQINSATTSTTTSPPAPASPPPPAPASPPPPAPASPPPAGPAPTPVINVQGSGGQAEDSVFVNGLNSGLGDGSQTNATYKWNFGDPGSQYNNLTGWNAGHIYNNAGTYTITLTVTNDLGISNTASTQVTVGSNARTTIYVDDVNGNDANSGLSPGQAIASVSRVQQVMDSYNDSNITVLFDRGETFYAGTYIFPRGNNEVFGAYGSGANPVMMMTGQYANGLFDLDPKSNETVIENLTFDSIFPATPSNAPEISVGAIYAGGQNVTIRNNTFLNVDSAVDCTNGPVGILIENNSSPLITGLRAYFVWMNGQQGVVLGNTVVNSTRQHIMRSSFASTQDWLIAGNNFTGYNDPADPNEIVKTTINIREGSYVYISDNTLTNDTLAFGPEPANGAGAYADYIVVDGNTLNNEQMQLSGGVNHFNARNNLLNFNGSQEAAILLVPTNTTYPTQTMSDVTIDNNTVSTTSTNTEFLDVEGSSPAGIITLKNNLLAAPNMLIGNDMVAVIYINSPQTTSIFAQVANNVWPVAANNPVMAGGEMYASALGRYDTNGYITGAGWDTLPFVQNDTFKTVGVSSGGTLQVAVGGQMAGAVLPPALS